MNIGIDFDGVLTDLASFIYTEGERYALANNIKIAKNENAFSTLEYYGWTEKDDQDFWESNNLKYTKYVRAKKGARHALKKLKEGGHKIIIITARHHCDKKTFEGWRKRRISETWLKKNKIPYDEIFYVGELSKVKAVVENKIDIFIDDSVVNLEDISKVVPVICFDEKYNHKYTNDNMTRFNSWTEIYCYLESIEKIGEDSENS